MMALKLQIDSGGKVVYDKSRPRFPSEYAADSYNQVWQILTNPLFPALLYY
jgi:hypothetical protein